MEEIQTIAPLPHLVFPLNIFRQLDFYYRTNKWEFQFFGLVTLDAETNAFVVTELVLNHHTASPAHADLLQDTFPALLDELEAAGKDITALRFQAHSHGEFQAVFSETDLHTIRHGYACDWMISFLGNATQNYNARLDVFSPITLSVALPIYVDLGEPSAEEKACWSSLLKQYRKISLLEESE